MRQLSVGLCLTCLIISSRDSSQIKSLILHVPQRCLSHGYHNNHTSNRSRPIQVLLSNHRQSFAFGVMLSSLPMLPFFRSTQLVRRGRHLLLFQERMILDFFYADSLVDVSVKHFSNQVYAVFREGKIRDSQRVVEDFI
jgi:hypothetical protein